MLPSTPRCLRGRGTAAGTRARDNEAAHTRARARAPPRHCRHAAPRPRGGTARTDWTRTQRTSPAHVLARRVAPRSAPPRGVRARCALAGSALPTSAPRHGATRVHDRSRHPRAPVSDRGAPLPAVGVRTRGAAPPASTRSTTHALKPAVSSGRA